MKSNDRALTTCIIASTPSDTQSDTKILAGLGARFAAQTIDKIITILILIPANIQPETLAALLSLLAFFSYCLFADSFGYGQSIGKRIIGIAVVDEKSGKPCTLGKSFVRNISLLLLGVLDVVLIFGKERKRLGDMLARTKVVNAVSKNR